MACAYCDQAVDYTDSDPVAVALIEHWRPWDEDADHTFYAHRAGSSGPCIRRFRRN